MENNTWRKERDLLSEAYQSIAETTHDNDAPALGKDEERQSDGSVKNTKTGETVYTPKGKENIEDSLDPEMAVNADQQAADNGQELEDGELESVVVDLINTISNPPPVDELKRLGYEGRIGEYLDMMNKKLAAAQAEIDLRKPKEG